MDRNPGSDPPQLNTLELDMDNLGSPDQWEHGLRHSPRLEGARNSRDSPSLRSRVRALRTPLVIYLCTTILTVLYCLYVHQALLSRDPQIGYFLLYAPNANLFISIISLILAALFGQLLSDALDQMRWVLAARPSGIPMSVFAVLSPATQLHAVALNVLRNWDLPAALVFGFVRLGLPLATLYYGAILKFGATFEGYFYLAETGRQIRVHAGLAVLDDRILNLIRSSRFAMYFQTFTTVLLSHERYAIPMSAPGCGSNCTSFILPGGLETMRIDNGPFLNSTLMEGGLFQGLGAIRIDNAPGFLLKYDTLPPDFDFDRGTECAVYGHGGRDSVQICTRPAPPSLVVGWVPCPSTLFDQDMCFNDTSWTGSPIRIKLRMSAFKQYTTTTYQRSDLSILDTTPTSEPRAVDLNESDYRLLWQRMMVPTNRSNDLDLNMIQSLTFNLGWLLRLYDNEFPDDINTALGHLQNFLAIPLQFMVTALQFANSSVPPELGGIFPLPGDMQTTAVGGESIQRLAGQPWTVWMFTATASLTVLVIGFLFSWMALLQNYLPADSSGALELDFAIKCGQARDPGDPVLNERYIARRGSPWRMACVLRRLSVRLQPVRGTASDWEGLFIGPTVSRTGTESRSPLSDEQVTWSRDMEVGANS